MIGPKTPLISQAQSGSRSDPPIWRTGTGVANGTFGELLQGALKNNDEHFLVTLPIQKFSTAVFTPDETLDRITVTPAHKSKSLMLVEKLLDHFGFTIGGLLSIESELPEGKGLASSSADMVAAVRALEAAIGNDIPIALLLATLCTIEPTDGVMYHEFVTFFHRKVELGRRLGFPSRLKVVAIDEGGKVDTIEYNKHNHLFSDEERIEYAELLAGIELAIQANDLERLGQIATRSAILNQRRNPKRHLDRLIAISEETGALGVVVAHSGPCLGLIFSNEPTSESRIAHARMLLSELSEDVFIVESLAPKVAC